MKPSQVSQSLRSIANRIDSRVASKRGLSKEQVDASIRGLLRNLTAATMWDDILEPLTAQDAGGSQLLWHAMKELGMNDWAPDTNIDDVVEKMKELAASVQVTDIQGALDYALANFDTYHEHYNPEKPPPGEAMDR